MRELWQKLSREMPPGSALVSNSFPVPDLTPSAVIDSGAARLYVYVVGDREPEAPAHANQE
jgi:hypothetical protein